MVILVRIEMYTFMVFKVKILLSKEMSENELIEKLINNKVYKMGNFS